MHRPACGAHLTPDRPPASGVDPARVSGNSEIRRLAEVLASTRDVDDRAELERLGLVAPHLELALEHADHRTEVTGRKAQVVVALAGHGGVAPLPRVPGLHGRDAVVHADDVALDLAARVAEQAEPDGEVDSPGLALVE